MNVAHDLFLFCCLLFAAGLGLPLPVAVPPLPDEPRLLAVAPADCLAFVAWNGTAAADARSTNLTERLAAEPEVRALVESLQQALLAAAGARGGDARANMPRRFLELGFAALGRPGCAFVRRIQYRPQRDLQAGIVVQLGPRLPDAKALMGSLHDLFAQRFHGSERHEDLQADGVTFHALPTDLDKPFLAWAELDDWFAIAVGEDVARQIAAGLRQRDQGLRGNADWQRLAPACEVARPSTRAFLDVQRTLALIQGSGGDQAIAVLTALGLDRATAAVSCTGLEGNGACARVRVAVPQRHGLLAAFDGRPLDQDELVRVPQDSTLALSVRLDANKLTDGLRALLAALTDTAPDALANDEQQALTRFKEQFGVDGKQDLLGSVGDQLTVWSAPSQGGLLVTGATALLRLRDGKAFGSALQTTMGKLVEQLAGGHDALPGDRNREVRPTLDTFTHAGRTVWWLARGDRDLAFAPAWTSTDEHFVLGLWPQTVRATLDADAAPNPDRSLARLPGVNKRGNATAMCCWNAAEVLTLGYPLLQLFMQTTGSPWQRAGFDFDVADLPRASALLPHLGRELTLVEPVEHGWALTRTGTLPLLDPLALLVAIGYGTVLADL